MIEICSHCGADNLEDIEDIYADDVFLTCRNCGESYQMIPAGDWGFTNDEWLEEALRRKQLHQYYQSLDDGEDDPDLEDSDL